MLKFFQQPFLITGGKFPGIPRELAAVVHDDPKQRADYERAVAFYARLTNPLVSLSLLNVMDAADAGALAAAQLNAHARPAVSVFPASTSRERRLFDRLFPLGFPERADFMQELIRAVQNRDVDLMPEPESGGYRPGRD